MESRYCCDCGVQLPKHTANFCPKGHPQVKTEEIKLEDIDRHPDDDNNDDDDDLQIISKASFQPSLRSKLPIIAAQDLR